jgi:hypothetical protein
LSLERIEKKINRATTAIGKKSWNETDAFTI